jgi:hypothetical protein
MIAKLKSVSLAGTIVAFAAITLPLCTQESGRGQSCSFPRAEEVSRRWLTRHPRPRDEAEKQIIAVIDDMQDNQARGMGNVLPEDGRLMRMLTESLEAKHVVEIGTATVLLHFRKVLFPFHFQGISHNTFSYTVSVEVDCDCD